MTRIISCCRESALVAATLALAVVQGLVYAGPCYTRTGGSPGCYSQGGASCVVINPVPNLPCPGGPWTIKSAIDRGLSIDDPCRTNSLEHATPKDGITSGNQPSGFMQQDDFAFWCSSEQTCTKVVSPYIPITVNCVGDPPVLCTSITVFTAGGGSCPPPNG